MNLQDAITKLQAYKTKNLTPGSFLSSILKNDLVGAVLKADPESKRLIAEITQYCWDNLPHNIWGSTEKVDSHLYLKPKQQNQGDNHPLVKLVDIQL